MRWCVAYNVLMSGPTGASKTLLARTLPSILPPISFDESLPVTKIYSVAGMLPQDTPPPLPGTASHRQPCGLVDGGNACPEGN